MPKPKKVQSIADRRFYSFVEGVIKDLLNIETSNRLGYPGGAHSGGEETVEDKYQPGARWIRELMNKTLWMLLNNAGSPQGGSSSFVQQTHDVEKVLVAIFAAHFSLQLEETSGHVVSCGTIANLTAAVQIRDHLEANGNKKVTLVTSSAAHYSWEKIARITRLPICLVDQNCDGSINLEDLKTKLAALSGSVIFVANMGTTELCGFDPVGGVEGILQSAETISDFGIHLDAALMGVLFPVLIEKGFLPEDLLDSPKLLSMTLSGHKFPGIQVPTGLFLAMHDLKPTNAKTISYLGHGTDGTIEGSRSGIAPILWLLRCKELGIGYNLARLTHYYDRCIEKARYLVSELPKLADTAPARFNEPGLQVVIPLPTHIDSAEKAGLIKDFQLMPIGEHHVGVYVLPGTRIEAIDKFIERYKDVITRPSPVTFFGASNLTRHFNVPTLNKPASGQTGTIHLRSKL